MITEIEKEILHKLSPQIGGKVYSLPLPTFCPACRLQRRFVYRNERHFYSRLCSFTKEPIISIYNETVPFPVYNQDIWWSDSWDPKSYSRDFDYSRSFFDQWQELRGVVPRIALLSKNSENSAYSNHAGNNKDCYLSTIVFNCENVYFSRKVLSSQQIFDSSFILKKGEILYQCLWGEALYHCIYCLFCTNSSDLLFCYDCKSCKDCFMSSNLRNKQYVFCNQQCNKEEYEAKLAFIDTGSFSKLESCLQMFQDLCQKAIRPALKIEKSENTTGDYLSECKDVQNCYYAYKGESCFHCMDFDATMSHKINKDCMDCYGFGSSELLYEVQAQANGYNNKFCSLSYDVSDCLYVDMCFNIKNCFGCVGLHAKEEYCVLNKQYTKEEYETLVPKIINHMRTTNEWGEFFPSSTSPFGYNETNAQVFFPLDKHSALSQGFFWSDYAIPPLEVETIATDQLPDHVRDTPDSILTKAIECEVSKKPFRLLKQELAFYRQNNIALPRKHPDIRYQERMKNLNLPFLYQALCHQCQKEIDTSYPPSEQHNIYCQTCYEKALY